MTWARRSSAELPRIGSSNRPSHSSTPRLLVLAYDPQSARLEHGELYVAMQKLLKRIDSAAAEAQLRMLETYAAAESELYAAVVSKAPVVRILGHHLGLLYGFQDCLTDVLRLSIALLQYAMDPQPSSGFPLSAQSPPWTTWSRLCRRRGRHTRTSSDGPPTDMFGGR